MTSTGSVAVEFGTYSYLHISPAQHYPLHYLRPPLHVYYAVPLLFFIFIMKPRKDIPSNLPALRFIISPTATTYIGYQNKSHQSRLPSQKANEKERTPSPPRILLKLDLQRPWRHEYISPLTFKLWHSASPDSSSPDGEEILANRFRFRCLLGRKKISIGLGSETRSANFRGGVFP